ncbi:MAG: hypothetical protein R2795_19985 [Saprospiraceae bacterium]
MGFQWCDIGIAPDNCVVQVNQLTEVLVFFGDIEAELGQSDCMPVTVSNFTEVVSKDFTMAWDEQVWLTMVVSRSTHCFRANLANFIPLGASSLVSLGIHHRPLPYLMALPFLRFVLIQPHCNALVFMMN